MTEYTVTSILLWIAGGVGIPYILGYFLSLLAENAEWWVKLPGIVKFIVPVVVAFLLPIGAHYLLQWDQLAVFEPIINIGIAGVVVWLGSQKGYADSMSTGYGVRFKSVEK
jgi:hypothetical protein